MDMHHIDDGALYCGSIDLPRCIIRLVAAAIYIGEVESAFFFVKHIDHNATQNVAVLVGTAKGIDDYAAVEVEGHVAVNMSCDVVITLRAAEHFLIIATMEVERDVSFMVRIIDTDDSQVGAAIEFANLTHAAANRCGNAMVDGCLVGTAKHLAVNGVITAISRQDVEVDDIDGTPLVGTAIHLVDKACIDV